jgi:hypothetical protein
MAAQAITAAVAWDMMGDKNAVANPKRFDPFSHCGDLAGDLVPQDERRFLDAVPLHHVRAAYPARLDANQELSGTDGRSGHLFETHVPVVVVHGNAHESRQKLKVKSEKDEFHFLPFYFFLFTCFYPALFALAPLAFS